MNRLLAILLLLAVPVVGTALETNNICGQCGMVNCNMPCCAEANRTAGKPVDGVICEVCGMVNCKMACKGEAVDWKGDKLMVMPGLPDWLFYASVMAILIFSFVIVEVLGRRARQQPLWRYNLFRHRAMKALFKSRFFPGLFQLILTVFFLFLIYAGLYGHQVINITPALTWTIWWAGLIFIILFFGKAWCTICPWDFMATALSSLRLWGVGNRPLTLGLKWPRWLRNIYPAIGLFIILTWLELGYHVTTSPKMTAYMAIGMLLLAIIPAFIFERKGFCRYGCFVGRISGLYANFAPVEVRSADKSVCSGCKTKDCYRGNENGNPCPTFLNLATLEDNTYCIMCGDCVKSCPHENVALNVRPFATDLFSYNQPRKDEAYLALILLSLTSFHGLTMTPIWENPAPSSVGSVRSSAPGISGRSPSVWPLFLRFRSSSTGFSVSVPVVLPGSGGTRRNAAFRSRRSSSPLPIPSCRLHSATTLHTMACTSSWKDRTYSRCFRIQWGAAGTCSGRRPRPIRRSSAP